MHGQVASLNLSVALGIFLYAQHPENTQTPFPR